MNIFATAKYLAEAHAKSGNPRQDSLTRMRTTAPFLFPIANVTAVPRTRPRRCTSKKDRFSTCLFCWRALRGRVRGTAVTLAIGKRKSAVIRIRVSESCRGLPQAGNGKVSRRCKMSRCHKTCLFCQCTLRGRVRGAAVTLAIGKRKKCRLSHSRKRILPMVPSFSVSLGKILCCRKDIHLLGCSN